MNHPTTRVLCPPPSSPSMERTRTQQGKKDGYRVNQYEQLGQHQPQQYIMFSFTFSLSFFSGLLGLCPLHLPPCLNTTRTCYHSDGTLLIFFLSFFSFSPALPQHWHTRQATPLRAAVHDMATHAGTTHNTCGCHATHNTCRHHATHNTSGCHTTHVTGCNFQTLPNP